MMATLITVNEPCVVINFVDAAVESACRLAKGKRYLVEGPDSAHLAPVTETIRIKAMEEPIVYTHVILIQGKKLAPEGFEEEWVVKFLDLKQIKAAEQVVEVSKTPAEEPQPDDDTVHFISTTHFQNWKVVTLLRGLGFTLERGEDEDIFVHGSEIRCVYEGWNESADGSVMTSFSELSDPESPHYGRHYVTAFRFTAPGGYDNVVAWYSSSTNSAQLFTVIGLGSYQDWQKMVEDEPERFGLNHWLRYNRIEIA